MTTTTPESVSQTPRDLSVGGNQEVSAQNLEKAWLVGQARMVEPITALLKTLNQDGKLDKTQLVDALQKAYKALGDINRIGETPESQVARMVSERLLVILALGLSNGETADAFEMLGVNMDLEFNDIGSISQILGGLK